MGGGGYHVFRRKFLGSPCRKNSLGSSSVFQKKSEIENFHAEEGGGQG